ncbi:MAG: putative sugar nucleotidyl transferase [Gemmatimonadaceae bacterium]
MTGARGGDGSGSSFVLIDDATARGFEPFALTRPAGELRAGGALIRHRWVQALGMPCTGFIGAAHLDAFAEFDTPAAATGTLAAGTVLVNARCAPELGHRGDGRPVAGASIAAAGAVAPAAWICDGRIAAVRLTEPLDTATLRADGAGVDELFARLGEAAAPTTELDGWWLDAVWDLIRHLNPMLGSDALAMMPAAGRATEQPEGLAVIGGHPVHIERGATVEPMVLVDATAGPVLVRRGATVQAFTRLVGPCIIGEGATVSGGRVASCSIGERCKVHGELNSVIMIGHANKSHDGFVGHSVIGRWANLGAGTITSNLKNSYGTVNAWTPDGSRSTGMQFLGSLLGDHVKTGIGTRLTTGCVVGAGANVFGGAMPPKVVPPFAWGEPLGREWTSFALDRFLVVATRVMARRQVELTAGTRSQLSAAHEQAHTAAYRARWVPPAEDA